MIFSLLVFFLCGQVIKAQKPVTFVLLTDLHVSPGTKADSDLHLIVDEINQTEIDFVIVSGDISNTGSDAELLTVRKALEKLQKPYYVLPGNHETNWSESAGLKFNLLWGDDRFMFSNNGYLFAGFNTGPYMKMGDGLVKQEDIAWLKRQLDLRKSKKEILVAVTHYPLSDGLSNWPEVTDLLRSYNCRLAFCGHGHRLGLHNFNGIPGIMGRSSLPGNSLLPGYNLVELRNDSVFVYDKEISRQPAKPSVLFNYIKKDALETLPVSVLPDYSVNKAYPQVKVKASFSDTASIFTGPCLINDSVLVYGNSLGWIKAIHPVSGKIVWQTRMPGPVYSTPVYSDRTIMLGIVDNRIIAINSSDGSLKWEVKTGRPSLAEGITENGSLFIGSGDGNFFRIDIRTGKILWQFKGAEGLIQGKPAVSGSTVIFGAWDTYLYCLDKKTGSMKWRWSNGSSQKLYSPGNIQPVISGKNVYIVAPDRFMTCIDIKSGKAVWRTNRHQVRESSGVSIDGSKIYAKLMNDTVIAVSAKEKYPKDVWTSDAGFGYEHNPCPLFAGGHMVVASTRAGVLVAMEPGTGEVLWKYKAGNSSVNRIAVNRDNVIWCTLAEGLIVGIEAKKTTKQ